MSHSPLTGLEPLLPFNVPPESPLFFLRPFVPVTRQIEILRNVQHSDQNVTQTRYSLLR